METRGLFSRTFGGLGLVLWIGSGSALGADPWADVVMSFDGGTTATPGGYTQPKVALGSPTRLAGLSSPFGTSVVSPFNPPYWTDEVVSIGEGGHLTVAFDEPVTNSASHLFGVDLLIFGNGGFEDVDFPSGQTSSGPTPSTFGMDAGMRVEVSQNGVAWFDLGASFTEGFFPTQGFLDGGPFDVTAGAVPSNFQRPVDPSLTLADFSNLPLGGIRALYDGSGGGTPIDLATSGLSSVSFVRISVPDDNNASTSLNVEIDGFSTVPEPGALTGFALLICSVLSRRR